MPPRKQQITPAVAEVEVRGPKTSLNQFRAIVDWLNEELGKNFKLINGDGQSLVGSVVAGAK
jgi:hypothetical protein